MKIKFLCQELSSAGAVSKSSSKSHSWGFNTQTITLLWDGLTTALATIDEDKYLLRGICLYHEWLPEL